MGVLGCPNMPQYPIRDDDCTDVAARSFDEDVGMLFAARRGHGTYAGPLWGEGFPVERVFCNDTLPPAKCRYMESYESKHSNHSLAAGIAAEIGVELPSLRLDSQAKYGEPSSALIRVDLGWGCGGCGGGSLKPFACFAVDFLFTEPPLHSTSSSPDFPSLLCSLSHVLLCPNRQSAAAGALSRGDASIFMRFPPVEYREKIWDHCAGSIIVEESGGRITDATGGRFLTMWNGCCMPLPEYLYAESASAGWDYVQQVVLRSPLHPQGTSCQSQGTSCSHVVSLLACCAGATVLTGSCPAAGKPLDFSQGRYLPLNPGQPGIIAATPSMHAAILKAYQKLTSSA